VRAIEGEGGRALAIQADAADADAVKGAGERTFETFGRLDVLVNNAGTCIPDRCSEEVAAVVAFIATPESSYVNGSNLKVDGA
jgi:NAD(P)-dependent dehydrogenase (short-subunit alcohol dehydrogenase family)